MKPAAQHTLAKHTGKALARKATATIDLTAAVREIAGAANTCLTTHEQERTRRVAIAAWALCDRAHAAMARIDPDDLDPDRPEDQARFAAAGTLVRGVVDILKTPVLNEAGQLSSASAKVLARTRKLG